MNTGRKNPGEAPPSAPANTRATQPRIRPVGLNVLEEHRALNSDARRLAEATGREVLQQVTPEEKRRISYEFARIISSGSALNHDSATPEEMKRMLDEGLIMRYGLLIVGRAWREWMGYIKLGEELKGKAEAVLALLEAEDDQHEVATQERSVGADPKEAEESGRRRLTYLIDGLLFPPAGAPQNYYESREFGLGVNDLLSHTLARRYPAILNELLGKMAYEMPDAEAGMRRIQIESKVEAQLIRMLQLFVQQHGEELRVPTARLKELLEASLGQSLINGHPFALERAMNRLSEQVAPDIWKSLNLMLG